MVRSLEDFFRWPHYYLQDLSVPRMKPWFTHTHTHHLLSLVELLVWPHRVELMGTISFIEHLGFLPTKNETMAPLHVATLTVQRAVPKYEHLGSLPYLCTKNETLASLRVATLTVQKRAT